MIVAEVAFQKLKESLFSDVVLAHPNYDSPFYLYTDASNLGIGARLMQADKNCDLRPIAYFSKSLNGAQKKYSTIKKEFLAIFESLKEFRFMILGYDIKVLTDHRPLSYLFRKKLPTDNAMARWSLEVETFNATNKYFEGKKNVVAGF